MNFTRVTQTDLPRITAFLEENAEFVMFPLNNLLRYGLDGGYEYAPRIWIAQKAGQITDMVSVTKAGMVMPFLPGGDFAAAAACLSGRNLIGVIGPAGDADGMRRALGMQEVPMALDEAETHFALPLSDLVIPEGETHVVPLTKDMRNIQTEWMIDYHIEVLGMTRDKAKTHVPERVSKDIAENAVVILMDGDTPVATTGFNAALPHIVQIGGVYTPPENRGRGLARRAVALHLAKARDEGVKRAVLFAHNPSAIAAYRAIGFTEIGKWRLAIFGEPQPAPTVNT